MSVTAKTRGSQGKNMRVLLSGIQKDKGVRGYKVGWPASATYPDGTQVSLVALWNEFGVPDNDLPERPFFRNANARFKNAVNRAIRKFSENGKLTKDGNARLAQLHVSAVQSSIRDLTDPENSPSTILQKGSSNPLIDTGLMRRTVNYEPLK